jgi:hypothetical protein
MEQGECKRLSVRICQDEAVAADHVVEHEGVLLACTPNECIAVGVRDRHAVQAVAQGRIARGGGSDEIAAQRGLRGVAIDQHALGVVPGDQIALRRPDWIIPFGNGESGRISGDLSLYRNKNGLTFLNYRESVKSAARSLIWGSKMA